MGRYDRYDHRYRPAPRGRYDRELYRDAGGPWTAWYPGGFWAGAPMFGWGGLEGWGWPPLAPVGYGPPPPRRSPRESPAYGRGGDRALRRWAERYGYDIEYSIPPRDYPPPGYRGRGRPRR